MKTRSLPYILRNQSFRRILLIPLVLGMTALSSSAGAGRIVLSGIDEALEAAAKLSGRGLGEAGERVARASLERAMVRHGESALHAARRGGIELFEAGARHGDEVLSWASQYPGAARSLALDADRLVPHVRHYGDDILRIESREPGTAFMVAEIFGREGIETLARADIPSRDYYRILGLGKRADSPATARQLLRAYRSGGTEFLERLRPGQILAGGLSIAMITAAWNTSDGAGDAMRKAPAVIPLTLAPAGLGFGIVAAVMLGGLAWRLARRSGWLRPHRVDEIRVDARR